MFSYHVPVSRLCTSSCNMFLYYILVPCSRTTFLYSTTCIYSYSYPFTHIHTGTRNHICSHICSRTHTNTRTNICSYMLKYSVQQKITRRVTSGGKKLSESPPPTHQTRYRQESITIPCSCAAARTSGKTAWKFMNNQIAAFGEKISFQMKRYLFSLTKCLWIRAQKKGWPPSWLWTRSLCGDGFFSLSLH